MSTPPLVFRSFGIPPAKIPANCGGPSLLPAEADSARQEGGGARLPAPTLCARRRSPPALPPSTTPPPTCGFERSFVTAFFRRFPPCISDSSAPLPFSEGAGPEDEGAGAGGGGGAPPPGGGGGAGGAAVDPGGGGGRGGGGGPGAYH